MSFNIRQADIIALKNKQYVGFNPSYESDEFFICDYKNKSVKKLIKGDLKDYLPIAMSMI